MEFAEGLKERQAEYVTVQKERDAAKEDVAKLAADAQEKEAALAVIKSNLEQVTQQVTSVQKQIADAGDIEKLVAQIEKLRQEQRDAEGAVANQNQRVASAQEDLGQITKQITALRDSEARGRRGIVSPEFTARIAQYFPAWDFAILNKGNASGVFANADLEVKRGRDVIAKLKVRNVEQHSSIADLVPGTLASGDSIRDGDVVVAAANQSAAQPEKPKTDAPATPADGAAGTAAQAPAPAPGGAPAMGSDPFAAPAAGAAPAAAPAMGGDPFATPAPAAAPAAGGAPAMNSDPFGAPAAPASTPAPAPGSAPAGTPAAPSTADPFSMAPAPNP